MNDDYIRSLGVEDLARYSDRKLLKRREFFIRTYHFYNHVLYDKMIEAIDCELTKRDRKKKLKELLKK